MHRIAFAILGMILFRNRFGFCENQFNYNISKTTCLAKNQKWMVNPFNFDTFPNALLLLFVVSTLDNWTYILSVAVNSNIETSVILIKKHIYTNILLFIGSYIK